MDDNINTDQTEEGITNQQNDQQQGTVVGQRKESFSQSAPNSPNQPKKVNVLNQEKPSERRSRSGSLLSVEGTYTSPLEALTQHVPTSDGEEEEIVTSDDFELLAVIGKGSFGKVLQVRKKNTAAIYAMKVIKKATVIQRKQVAHTQAERDILLKIDFPFIVKLHYAFQSRDKLYLVLDFVNGGELFHHLRKEGKFSEERTRFYAAELVLAISHLHSMNIIYRDLKAENILLDKSGHIVITDFGISKEMRGKDNRTNTLCGTPEYLAPEILKGEPHGKSVDWWSLGNLVYEMLSGSPPFYHKNVSSMYRNILFGELPLPESISEDAKSFVKSLLTRDVDKRLGSGPLGSEEVKLHPFFRNIDWEALEQKKVVPPFLPNVKDSLDLSQIDTSFTREKARDTMSESEDSHDDGLFQGFSFSKKKNPGKFRADSLKLKLQQQIIHSKMKSVPTSPHDDMRKSPLSRSPDLEDDSPIAIMSRLPPSPHKSEMDSSLVTLAKSLPDIHSALATLSSMPSSPPDAEKPVADPQPVSSKKPDPFADMDFDKMIDNFFSAPPPSVQTQQPAPPPTQPEPLQSAPAVSTPTSDDKDLHETPTKPRHLFKSTSFCDTTSPHKEQSTSLPSLPRVTSSPALPQHRVSVHPSPSEPILIRPTVQSNPISSTPSQFSQSLGKKLPSTQFQVCSQCGQDLNYIRQLEQQNSWLHLKLEETKLKMKKYKEKSKVSSFLLSSNANAPSVASSATTSGTQTPATTSTPSFPHTNFDYEKSIVEQVKKLKDMLLDQKKKVEHFYVQNLQKEREKLMLHQQLQEAHEQIQNLQFLLQQETMQREHDKMATEQLEGERKRWAAQVLQMCMTMEEPDSDEEEAELISSVHTSRSPSRSSSQTSLKHKISF